MLIREMTATEGRYARIANSKFIDTNTWITFLAAYRRKLVKRPETLFTSADEFETFKARLSNLSKGHEETKNKAEKERSVSRALEFLFPLALKQASTDCEQNIVSYKALCGISDLRNPPNWYPLARLMKRKIIYHGGPTNSGKTYQALQRLMAADPEQGGGLYCGPLRLLALEIYESMNKQGIYTDLLTGQEKRQVPFATHISCTLEMVNLQRVFDVAVIDEIQMIAHNQRGYAWTKALQGLRAREIHVCGGLEASSIVADLVRETGDEFELIKYERFSELQVEETSLRGDYSKIEPGDCVVAFSRADIFSIKRDIERLTPHKCCIIYGQLPPETRSKEAHLFNDENSGFDVLVASDAIGMGLNLNIRRIVFHTTMRRGGDKGPEWVDPSSVKQIGGRAGRLSSVFKNGKVTAWQENDLAYIKAVMSWEIQQLTRSGIFPTVEQVEMFSKALVELQHTQDDSNVSDKKRAKFADSHSDKYNDNSPKAPSEMRLSLLLERFVELAQMDGRYFMSEYSDLVTVANWLHTIPLSLEDRFIFANAPVNIRDHLNMNILYHFAAGYAQQRPVGTNVRISGQPPEDIFQLTDLCIKHAVLDLYLWLSFRFPKYFIDRDACQQQKALALRLINDSLRDPSLQQEFSHSKEYQGVRAKAKNFIPDGLPPAEWGEQVRSSTMLELANIRAEDMYCFPHEEGELQHSTGKSSRRGKGKEGSKTYSKTYNKDKRTSVKRTVVKGVSSLRFEKKDARKM
jgi:ATP-dependent RNA helicase SUPV3L1/SUV3